MALRDRKCRQSMTNIGKKHRAGSERPNGGDTSSQTAASVKPRGRRAHAVAFNAFLAYGIVLTERKLLHRYGVKHRTPRFLWKIHRLFIFEYLTPNTLNAWKCFKMNDFFSFTKTNHIRSSLAEEQMTDNEEKEKAPPIRILSCSLWGGKSSKRSSVHTERV